MTMMMETLIPRHNQTIFTPCTSRKNSLSLPNANSSSLSLDTETTPSQPLAGSDPTAGPLVPPTIELKLQESKELHFYSAHDFSVSPDSSTPFTIAIIHVALFKVERFKAHLKHGTLLAQCVSL